MLELIKKELIEAGIRVGCAQAVHGVRGVLSSVLTSPKAQSFLNSRAGGGLLTSAVGLGLGQATPDGSKLHTIAQAVAHECRVQGLANVGCGVLDRVFSREDKSPAK